MHRVYILKAQLKQTNKARLDIIREYEHKTTDR